MLPARLVAHIGHDDDSGEVLSDSDGTPLKPPDAFALEHALKAAARLWIVVRQQTRRHDGDLAAETLKGLRELHAERTAADDEQRCRQLRMVKDVVVREVWRPVQAGD